MQDIEKIIAEYKADPFETYVVTTPHTGVISLKVKKGDKVKGTTGKWLEKKGTILFTILRQGNLKPVYAPIDGEIVDIEEEKNEQFVEAKTPIMSIRHRLNKEEIVKKIIERFLFIFRAPETAKYYFTPELNKKLAQKGQHKVIIQTGEEFLIMSRMKRDVPLIYEGEPGIIYTIYFKPNVTVEQGKPLLGICPPDQINFISNLVNKIQLEWENI